MRILLLTQWFQPEPSFKGLPFARELAARGHEVQVLTGFPNYPNGVVYPGYRIRLWQRENIEGVEVIRVPLYPSHNHSAIARAFNYLSFCLAASSIGTLLVQRPDVIYAYHPPLTTGLAAGILGKLRGSPFVYDIQDLWPDTVAASGMLANRLAMSLLHNVCNFVYRAASHVTVSTPGFRKKLIERGVPDSKIDIIYNWSDEVPSANPKSDSVLQIKRADRFAILFAGTMGTAQALENVLAAAKLCMRSTPHVDFVFLGGGIERQRLEQQAADMQLGNVRFLPRQPLDRMSDILKQADALLVHLADDPLFRITIPSKVQAYMAAGKPVLMGCKGDAADLVERAGCGVVCEPGNSQSIADAVRKMSEMSQEQLIEMGHAGRVFYKRELSLSSGVGQFERIFIAASQRLDATKAHERI